MATEKFKYTNYPGNTYVQLTSDISDDDIDEIIGLGILNRIQANFIPSNNTLVALNEKYYAKFPDVGFRLYGLDQKQTDVSCLRILQNVQVLSLDSLNDLSGLDSLAELPNLYSLNLHAYLLRDFSFLNEITPALSALSLDTKNTAFDLSVLLRFKGLKVLRLHKYKKNIETLAALSALEALTLRGVTPDSLAFVNAMSSLRRLKIELGAKNDLSDLYGNANILALRLFKISHLDNAELISRLPSLEAVELIQLPHITAFPNLSAHMKLKHICLDDMKGINDLSALEYSPALESFSFVCAPRTFEPNCLLPLLRNSSVQRCQVWGAGSARNEGIVEVITRHGKEVSNNSMDVRSALYGRFSEF